MNWGKQTSLMKKDQDGFCPIKGIYEKLSTVLEKKGSVCLDDGRLLNINLFWVYRFLKKA